jgi:prepilin-type N-terminal cleavage/methylation domain-containing protein
MNRKLQKSKAFTLLEILIATGIFAIVMVITVGIVSQSAGFQSKIRAQRQTYEEARRLSDQISQDIRGAATSANVISEPSASGPGEVAKFNNGLILLQCFGNSDCNYKYSRIPLALDSASKDPLPFSLQTNGDIDYTNGANTLLIFTKDEKIILYTLQREKVLATAEVPIEIYHYRLYYKKIDIHDIDDSSGAIYISDGKWKSGETYRSLASEVWDNGSNTNLISTSELDVMVQFGGYTPGYLLSDTDRPDQQAYISFKVIARSIDLVNHLTYGLMNVLERGFSIIKTTVTSRNYSN